MVSLRFPFSFSQPPTPRATTSHPFSAAAAAAAFFGAGAAAVSCIASSQDPRHQFVQNALDFFSKSSLPMWGSLSLADDSPSLVEPKTGVSFPPVLGDSRRLLGIGLRKKSVLGLKNIDVYAFGVYADDQDIKSLLGQKYGKLSNSELKEKKVSGDDILESDVSMTVRLQIAYSRLSIRSVRSAFEESVGTRLRKFGGSDNKELLQRFTSLFKDEYKIPSGSVIDLSREQGHVLHTTIDGKEVGSIQSKLLCKSILDLYIGEDPFDQQAKEDVELNAAYLLHK